VKISAFLIIVFASISAFADFNGYWSGRGTFDGYNGSSHCDEISFDVRQSDLTLAVKYGFISCEGFQNSVEPMIYVIHEDHLVLNDETVGTIKNDNVHLDYINKKGIRLVIDASNRGNVLVYHESAYDYRANRVYKLDGLLNRK
jgi:hypothetical protein